VKEVPLTKGLFALVDDDDFAEVSKLKWRAGPHGYAISGGKTTIYMHRFILGARKGQEVDHINHQRRDNRLSNLRFLSHLLNRVNNSSRGIFYKHRKWFARVKHLDREYQLGAFKMEAEALTAVRVARESIFYGRPITALSYRSRYEFHNVKNTSGYRGIFRLDGKWGASVTIRRVRHYLGTYPTKEEAARVRQQFLDRVLPLQTIEVA
jgi:hypothetical protein